MKLVFAYSLFALLATAANIAAQEIIIRIYGGMYNVFISVMVGTGVGLVVKYVLDKRYIFRFTARTIVHDGQVFALYTLMGLVTTVIFWGFEFGFHHIFGTKSMRYLGGIIGLAIGYFTKYQLDKRYVFRTNEISVEKKHYACDPSEPVFLTILTILPLFISAYFYISYSSKGWFLQDDFEFLAMYASSPAFDQILDFSNFGRLISRNLYWYLNKKIFSDNAQYYFALNFFIIATTSYLIYRLFSQRLGTYAGLVGSLLYFCSPAVITGYIWLSNSQHLLGHFFVVFFIFKYIQSEPDSARGLNALQMTTLLCILFAGLLSNIFVGLVLSLPAWHMLTDQNIRKDGYHWLLMAIGSILFVVFIYMLIPYQSGAYAAKYELATLMENLTFYFSNGWTATLWIAAASCGAFISWRSKRLFEAWLFLASPVYFLPFAFLEHQRYLQYGTLTYLFILLGSWAIICRLLDRKYLSIIYYAGCTLVLVIGYFAMTVVKRFEAGPWGADQRELVHQLKAFNLTEGSTIKNFCFQSSRIFQNTTGVKAWDIPPEWWGVEFGKAFLLFVDPTKTYRLKGKEDTCDVTFVINGSRLEKLTE